MKNFFKKYLWIVIYFFVSAFFMTLSIVWIGFMMIGSLLLGLIFLYFANKLRGKYKQAKDFDDDDFYFDATKYDFDEDIYYIGEAKDRNKKPLSKNLFARANASMPSIALYILGIAFLAVAVMGVVKIFIGI